MASKNRSVYQCAKCEHQEPKWLGRCPECGEWNSFREIPYTASGPAASAKSASAGALPSGIDAPPLADIPADPEVRMDAGFWEINQVLGGGIMRGSSILIGGEPGIGKSTLMLQIAASLTDPGEILYVSGEESPGQIKMRADRLGVSAGNISLVCETRLEVLLRLFEERCPRMIIVDSIQTMISEEAGAFPGTVNQIKACGYQMINWAKENGAALFLVAHVTKGGTIAGPKVLEHMVDTVLLFEAGTQDLRLLNAVKNRFGSVDEMGLFRMDEKGLKQVDDPARLFLEERQEGTPPGVAVAPVYEGSRVLLVEIQALTVPAKGGVSRVFSDRIDTARVSRIAAVLEKHLGLTFSTQDIYVNVAGGMRLTEVGTELPLAMALYSARTGLAVPPRVAVAGELSLTGEIRKVPHLARRRKSAAEMGFDRFISPEESRSVEAAVKAVFSEREEGKE